MTDLIVAVINLLSGFFNSFIPVYDISASTYNTLTSGISAVVGFLGQANCIVPLSDISAIFLVDIGIRVFKIALFGGNWIIRRITDVIP